MMKKYGVNNPSQLEEFQLKKIINCLKRTGYSSPNKNPSVKKIKKEIYREKYGVNNPSQLEEFQLKKRKTSLKNWNTLHPMQSPVNKEKVKDTCQKKYGVNHPMQSPVNKEKVKDTCQKKYGCDSSSQKNISEETFKKLNNPVWLEEQHHTLKKTCARIAEELADVSPVTISNYLHKYNISIKSSFRSQGERDLAEFISSIYSKPIIENDRSVISPLELDVFLPDLKIAFEYNGEYWHKESSVEGMGVPLGYHRTKTSLCRTKGIKLYHIWERHWANNQEKMKQTIINIVREKK